MKHGMPTWPFRSIHGKRMSDVSCHLRIWATHMVGRRQTCIPSSPFIVHMVVRHRVWHEIITLRHDTLSDYGGRGMPSSPLSSSQGRDMSGEACHHIPWTTYTVEKRRAFHAIVVFGLHTQSDDVRHGMPACPLGRKYCKTTSGKAFHHRP